MGARPSGWCADTATVGVEDDAPDHGSCVGESRGEERGGSGPAVWRWRRERRPARGTDVLASWRWRRERRHTGGSVVPAGDEEAALSPKLPHEESHRARRGPATRLGDGSTFLGFLPGLGDLYTYFLGLHPN
jgi:hypothetical protein